MATGTDPSPQEWLIFWLDVAGRAATFSIESTSQDLDDILAGMWARVTTGERPRGEHVRLLHLLLTLAGAKESDDLETLLVHFGPQVRLPSNQDRLTTTSLFSAIDNLRAALDRGSAAEVCEAVARYIILLRGPQTAG